MQPNVLIHKKRRALIFKVREPARITTVIPTAKVLDYKGHKLVAVPHRLDEMIVLNNLGFTVPSPIRYAYNWPGRHKPFAAQIDTAEFLTQHHRAFCLNDMGTGKTMATLWAYDFLKREGKVDKMLVVCPLSTMEPAWGNDIFRNFPHLTYTVLHGSRDKRTKLLDVDSDIYIINHDGLEIVTPVLKERDDINLLVVDEIAQVARNAGTDRWKTLNVIANKQVSRRVWGLTGTPTPNAPTDAWAQCKLLVPEKVPPYFNRFRDQVMRQSGPYKWVARDNATEQVKEAMQPAIRFSRDECIDLPECMMQTRTVAMSTEQKKAYKEMMTHLKTEVNAGQMLAVNEAVKLSKLVQIACGVGYGTDGEEISIPAKERLETVYEIVEEAGSKTIVFVPFISAITKVAKYLSNKGVTVETIHGGVSKRERDRIFNAFQNSYDPQVIVAQPAAMSHGLTLTAANTIVWYAPITSNDVYQQANARVSRPGQKLRQLIVNIEGSPVERKLYDRLEGRQKMQGLLLDLVKTV